MAASRSLVLITVDCLRADHVGFLGYNRPTTPFLDSLAGESFVFPAAVVAGAPTYYSFPGILASRYPLAFGRDIIGLSPDEPTLVSVLGKAGYVTAAFAAGNPYLSRRFGYDSGFATFRDFLDSETGVPFDLSGGSHQAGLRSRINRHLARLCHKAGPVGPLYDELYFQYCQRLASPPASSFDALRRFPPADVVVDQARAWLAGAAQGPFFLWLHLMDPHSPYYPPRKALGWMGQGRLTASRARYLNSYWNRGDLGANRLKRQRDEVIALYDAGIRWVDVQVARLVDTLRHFRLWDQCILALTADHGEEFLDHGGRYHAPSKVTEELVRVPLLVRVPGASKVSLSNAPFSLLHLAPTLLEALDAPVPAEFRGRSYWPQLQKGESWDEEAIVECVTGCTNPLRNKDRLGPRILAVREARYKLVLDFSSGGERLFDLEADPAELQPLRPEVEKAVRKRLLERAHEHCAESVQARDSARRLGARLRELRLKWAHSENKTSV